MGASGRRLTLYAPAKVNLHLDITGRRPDGFHEILSIFQAIDLCDRVRIRSLKTRDDCQLRCSLPIPKESNTAFQAAQLFGLRTGLPLGVSIELSKRIPIGSGLGGGSSDAAAVLAGLNGWFGRPLAIGALRELASELGSDVPFFLHGGAAIVSGRGEAVKRLPSRHDFLFVLAYPGFPIRTVDAYRWFDEEACAGGPAVGAGELERSYREDPVCAWRFSNSFREVVERRYPAIRQLRGRLAEGGARCTGLSGSGSAVFGLFTEPAQARRAAARLRAECPVVILAKPLRGGGAEHYNWLHRPPRV